MAFVYVELQLRVAQVLLIISALAALANVAQLPPVLLEAQYPRAYPQLVQRQHLATQLQLVR